MPSHMQEWNSTQEVIEMYELGICCCLACLVLCNAAAGEGAKGGAWGWGGVVLSTIVLRACARAGFGTKKEPRSTNDGPSTFRELCWTLDSQSVHEPKRLSKKLNLGHPHNPPASTTNGNKNNLGEGGWKPCIQQPSYLFKVNLKIGF